MPAVTTLMALLAGAEARRRRAHIRAQKRLHKRLYDYSTKLGGCPTIHLKRDRTRWSTGSDNIWDYSPIVCLSTDGRYRSTTELQWVTCPFCIDAYEAGYVRREAPCTRCGEPTPDDQVRCPRCGTVRPGRLSAGIRER